MTGLGVVQVAWPSYTTAATLSPVQRGIYAGRLHGLGDIEAPVRTAGWVALGVSLFVALGLGVWVLVERKS